jgi:WD40 repeat protein
MAREELLDDDATLEDDTAVKAVACSPCGRFIASGCYDQTIKVWRVESRQPIRTFKHEDDVRSVVFSVDSKAVFSASHDGTVRRWDIESGEDNVLSRGVSSLCVTMSSDGKRLAATYSKPFIRLFDLPIHKEAQFRELTGFSP